MTIYYISGGSDEKWVKTNAQTMRGAKVIASKTYQKAVGGKIEIAQGEDCGDAGTRYTLLASKYGYSDWQQP